MPIPPEPALTVTLEMPARPELPYTPRYTLDLDLAVIRSMMQSGRSSDIGWHLVPALQELVKAYDEERQPQTVSSQAENG